MNDFAQTAQTLKAVRDAQRRFLALWALDCLLEESQFARRLLADVEAAPCGAHSSNDSGGSIHS